MTLVLAEWGTRGVKVSWHSLARAVEDKHDLPESSLTLCLGQWKKKKSQFRQVPATWPLPFVLTMKSLGPLPPSHGHHPFSIS